MNIMIKLKNYYAIERDYRQNKLKESISNIEGTLEDQQEYMENMTKCQLDHQKDP